MSIYPCPCEVVFDVGSELKIDFSPLIKDLSMKPVYSFFKNKKLDTLVDQFYQLIHDLLLTKDICIKLFDFMNTWCETLTYIACKYGPRIISL